MQKRTTKKNSKKKRMLREPRVRYVGQRRKRKSAVERAIEYGVDVSLLRQNLRMTPTQRLENFQRWLAFAEEVRRAGEKMRMQNGA